MKRVIRLMGMMALVALAFTSCKKTEEKSVFTAATEQFVTVDEERAYIDDALKIHFELGDVCMLFNISTDDPLDSHCATYAAVEDGNIVEFQNCGLGTVAENVLDAGYYAYYPGNVGGANHIVTELEDGENKAMFLVRPTQDFRLLPGTTMSIVSKEDMYMASKVDDAAHLADAHFTFRNLCGILALKPFEARQRTVTKIEVVDNTFNLTGWVEVILPELDPDEMVEQFNTWPNPNLAEYISRVGYHTYDQAGMFYGSDVHMKGNKVTMNVPGGVQLGASKNTTTTFNIVLRPLAMSNGCHIIFTFDNGEVKDIEIPAGTLIMKPNVVRSAGLNMDAFPG